ncbi:MAG: helix-turn-helix transcriptional regulator [Lachnospiraceae bacterium]|uniref:helix-turn-helix domain-containing protein n=1 Tax=Roseburia hominis TaxID=301301 RepID=UPI001F410696|nr:helix-turn-helix transcriptional regulator [Roseburia hominis]MCI5711721.1 helix-turn-helix domain-containing protein [Lachnospiraceae bacterium]MDD6170672.1 helix-turn-helix transcriptional regulator [Lachnospiraceae bacterium]
MEFNEKLQKLRKDRGLTQEELAEALFVSRTAISKWESGRGYPSIDSLKEISKFFSVTIDELLSTERLLSIAERENKSNIQKMCNLLLGIVDLFSFVLIVLPLYPNPVNGYIYAVNLFNYTETTSFNKLIYWIMFLSLIVVGAVKIVLTQCKIEKGQNIVTGCSMILSILTVLFLAMAKEAYAITLVFILLIIKGMLLFKHSKNA